MAKRKTRALRRRLGKLCVSQEISKHCHKKKGQCKPIKERNQAIAIAYSICRRRGFSVAKRK